MLKQLIDAVAGETLGGGVLQQAGVRIAEEAMISSAEPECAGGVLQDRPDLLLGEGFGDGILEEVAVTHVADTSFGADPEIAVAGLKQRTCAEVGEPVLHTVVAHGAATDVAEAIVH